MRCILVKKIIIILVLILILIEALYSFAINKSPLILSTYQKENSDITIFEIKTDKNIYDQNDKYMRITIYNNSDDDIATGHGYVFEIRMNNKWYDIYMDYFVILSYLGIGSSEKHYSYFYFDDVSYKFVPGYEYRLIKEIDNYIIVSNIFKFE